MVNLFQRIHYSYACAFYFSLPFSFSHRDPMYCTLSFNCVQVQTLPTEQAAPALTDSFSRSSDPYTHACKARPLTTVGRASLSVIVIIGRFSPQPHSNNTRRSVKVVRSILVVCHPRPHHMREEALCQKSPLMEAALDPLSHSSHQPPLVLDESHCRPPEAKLFV